MTNTCIEFPSSPTETAIAKDGAIYNEISDIYTKLYQLEGTLRCAIPGLESGDTRAMEATYLVADILGQMAEKLDLLSSRVRAR